MTGEALAILAGGGIEHMDEGYEKLMIMRKRQVNEYMHRLEVIGLGDRRERMAPGMQRAARPGRLAAALSSNLHRFELTIRTHERSTVRTAPWNLPPLPAPAPASLAGMTTSSPGSKLRR